MSSVSFDVALVSILQSSDTLKCGGFLAQLAIGARMHNLRPRDNGTLCCC